LAGVLNLVMRMIPMAMLCVATALAAEVLRHQVPAAVLRKAEHASSERAPHGKQQHQQQHHPDAQLSHGVSLSQRRLVKPSMPPIGVQATARQGSRDRSSA
jgi:hypothetical protein